MFGNQSITYPSDGTWQFVRVVRTSGAVDVCLNGHHLASLAIDPNPPSTFTTYYPPDLGKEDAPRPEGAFFDGLLDDVRVITGALPCN